jgi:NADH-quinone oxidoreductase subunit K
MEFGIGAYAFLATTIFGIGALGFVLRRNFLVQLMSVELMLNAVNLLFVAFNRIHVEQHGGQTFAFIIIAVAAAEAALGLAIAIAYHRMNRSVETDLADRLRH